MIRGDRRISIGASGGDDCAQLGPAEASRTPLVLDLPRASLFCSQRETQLFLSLLLLRSLFLATSGGELLTRDWPARFACRRHRGCLAAPIGQAGARLAKPASFHVLPLSLLPPLGAKESILPVGGATSQIIIRLSRSHSRLASRKLCGQQTV